MTFRVGQEVECVDAEGTANLALGEVYTIKHVGDPQPRFWFRGFGVGVGVLLFEAKPNVGDVAFASERFRPIVERKTDISIFTRLLVPGSKVSEPV